MCKFCEFDGGFGEYFAMDKFFNVPDSAMIAIETEIARYLRIRKDESGNYMLSLSVPYEDAKKKAEFGIAGCIIKHCPFCGRQLDGQRYRVEANWIHPHKDSVGEYLDDLTYEQAEAVRKMWVKDKIHKNVELSKSVLPFQG